VIGSAGLLEVAVRDGSATERLRVGRGAEVRVQPSPEGCS
jgi:S-adenosylmethionine hydrolase